MDESQLLSDQPLGHKLIKKWFWLYFFMIITAPVWYLVKVLVSNSLSVEDIGVFYSVLGLVVLLSSYSDLGLTEALQYFLPKYWLNKEYNHYKTVLYVTFFVQFFMGVLIALWLWFGSDWLALHHFHSPASAMVLRTLCLYFIGASFLWIFQSIFFAFQDVTKSNIINTVNIYTVLLFTFIFWFFQWLTLFSFSYAWISWVGVWIVVSALFFLWKYKKTLQKGLFVLDNHLLRTQFSYAFRVFLWANVGTLLGQVDQQLVVNFLWTKDAGYYSNFFTLFGTYNIIITPFLTLLFPIVTELYAKHDMQKLSLLQNIFYKYFSVFALTIGWIFVAFGPHIASILFGSKFLYSGTLLQYIAIGLVFNVLVGINFGILAGIGKAKERVKVLAWALFVNILINVLGIFVLKIGILSPIFGLIGWWVILTWRSYLLIHKNCPISFDWKYLFWNLGVIIILIWFSSFFIAPRLILNDSLRYSNLLRFLLWCFGYYVVIALVNWKSISVLVNEIKVLRKSI